MISSWTKSRSLKQLLLLSWAAPAALTLVASFSIFLFLGWLDYQNNIDVMTADLREKSKTSARRISAELLLQEHGATESVIAQLKEELSIQTLNLSESPTCVVTDEVCTVTRNGLLTVVRQIPQVTPAQFVELTQESSSLSSFLNAKFLLWSTLPVFFLIAVGLFVQLLFLRRKIIDPVSSLAEAADTNFKIQDNWPFEVKQIADELKDSFEAKEQAVFALLTKGVIHDIKTFMHSLLIATDLIGESPDESKRIRRLENLYSASKSSLPKIKRIIELTLDGSRDISVQGVTTNLIDTIRGAVNTNAAYAREKNVTISLDSPDHLKVVHDPVQLERALANLIKNGIEAFSHNESKDDIHREVKISVKAPSEESIQVAIEDSGPGYTGESSHFMPTKSHKAHGAGLGLYITQKIVHGHQGKVEVTKSTLLGGAKFSISLPSGGRA